MSDLLVSLIELIVISFISLMVFDFIVGLIYLARSVQSQSKIETEPKVFAESAITPMTELPDPWTLPAEVPVIFQRLAPSAQSQMKPLLLLPQANEITTSIKASPIAEPVALTVKEFEPYTLALEDIATLKLRTARKVAGVLGIKQKVNGKDKSLDWLQREIRQRLSSHQQEVIAALEITRKAS